MNKFKRLLIGVVSACFLLSLQLSADPKKQDVDRPIKERSASKKSAEKIVCSEPRPQMCTMDYTPVCATLSDGKQKTFANGCGACSDINVNFYQPSEC